MRRTGCAIAALALLSGCDVLGRYEEGTAMVTAVRTRLDQVAPLRGGEEADEPLCRFYEQRKFHPAWTEDRRQRRRARAALELLLRSGTQGDRHL
jgi:hypothetical protein